MKLAKKDFLTVFRYFEPIVHIKGSYSNETCDDGFTLAEISQLLKTPSFIPDNDFKKVKQEIKSNKGNHKGILYGFYLGPDYFSYKLYIPKIKKIQNPINK